MLGRLRIAIAVCFTLACAGTEGIETGLQNDPDRGWVRVLSLVVSEPPDIAITHDNESPVTFAGRAAHMSPWRQQVSGDVSAWALQDGVTLAGADFVLLPDAHATVLMMAGDAHPRVSWLDEKREGGETQVQVRFINALASDSATATVNGKLLGGVLDASSASGWFALEPFSEATLAVSVSGASTESVFENIAGVAGTFVTLAVLPEGPDAAVRLLASVESSEYQPLSSIVMDAEPAP